MNFKDDVSPKEGVERVVVIRGTTESAQQAEYHVRRIIAEQPPIVTEEILVPDKAVGRIIGELCAVWFTVHEFVSSS